jgi:glucose/arabinose dehydrogenase
MMSASIPSAGSPSASSSNVAPLVSLPCDATNPPKLGALGLQMVLRSTTLKTLAYAAQPPDSKDWYLVEQSGKIWILSGGKLSAAPFFDVSSDIQVKPDYEERGLHAIEFARDFAKSGLFYVVLTPTKGAQANRDLVLEYRRSEADPTLAEKTPTRELLNEAGIATDGLLNNVHNNYLAKFGPDGMLYIGTGDGGGSCNDNTGFQGSPQDTKNIHGKILRLDLTQPAPYGAKDNPFAATGDARVLHFGLRNPFRFSWDAETGDLYIGDVGQDAHEEINVALAGKKGLNFGWPAYEGKETGTGMSTSTGGKLCPKKDLAAGSEAVMPVFFTDHGGGGNQFGAGCNVSPFCDFGAIVGGFVYRGKAIPALRGAYLFGDWVSDNMAAIYSCAGQTSQPTVIDYVRDLNLPKNGYFSLIDDAPELKSITAVLEDQDRELYLIANGDSLLKIVPAP